MTEATLHERAAAFQKALAAALSAAGVSGVAAYALLPGGGPVTVGEGKDAILRLPDAVGGDAVRVVNGRGRRVAEIDSPTACVLLAQLAARLDQLKQHYAALFGREFSSNFERMLGEHRAAAAAENPTVPFDRAMRDLAAAFKPCIVLGATIATRGPGGEVGTQGSSGVMGERESFDELVPALGMLHYHLASLLTTLAERHGVPIDEAAGRVAAAAAAVEEDKRRGSG